MDLERDHVCRPTKIRASDELKVFDAPFRSSRLVAVGMYNHDDMDVWFDEIYVGHDDSMYFVCPQTRSLGRVFMKRPTQTEWDEQNEFQDETWNITRHESYVSRRSLYVFLFIVITYISRTYHTRTTGTRRRIFMEDSSPRTENHT